MTEYVVLKKESDNPGWLQLAETQEGTSDQDAIRKALRHVAGADGEYVAIPVRSFHPRKVETETRSVVLFTE